MPYSSTAEETPPSREELDRTQGALVVEFGSQTCPICQGFAPQFEQLMEDFPDIRHIKIEDGKGQPLGRSYRVKLWPTFVFLKDGDVAQQSARPTKEEARQGLEAISH